MCGRKSRAFFSLAENRAVVGNPSLAFVRHRAMPPDDAVSDESAPSVVFVSRGFESCADRAAIADGPVEIRQRRYPVSFVRRLGVVRVAFACASQF